MIKNYWVLFGISVLALIVCLVLFVVIIVFSKKMISIKNGGIVLFVTCVVVCLCFIGITFKTTYLCMKDYIYIQEDHCIKVYATVVEFTSSKFDYDGNGKINNSNPKMLIEGTNEYVVLNLKDVEIGRTYYIRYLPNTRLCEVIKSE